MLESPCITMQGMRSRGGVSSSHSSSNSVWIAMGYSIHRSRRKERIRVDPSSIASSRAHAWRCPRIAAAIASPNLNREGFERLVVVDLVRRRDDGRRRHPWDRMRRRLLAGSLSALQPRVRPRLDNDLPLLLDRLEDQALGDPLLVAAQDAADRTLLPQGDDGSTNVGTPHLHVLPAIGRHEDSREILRVV